MQFVLGKGTVAASACLALAYACLSARRADAFGLGLGPIPSAASSFHPGGTLPNTIDVGSSGGEARGMIMYSAFKKGGGKGKKKKGGGGKKSAGGRGGGGKGGGRGGGRGDGGPPSPTVDTSRKVSVIMCVCVFFFSCVLQGGGRGRKCCVCRVLCCLRRAELMS